MSSGTWSNPSLFRSPILLRTVLQSQFTPSGDGNGCRPFSVRFQLELNSIYTTRIVTHAFNPINITPELLLLISKAPLPDRIQFLTASSNKAVAPLFEWRCENKAYSQDLTSQQDGRKLYLDPYMYTSFVKKRSSDDEISMCLS